mgnify:CR=1 FL=1
MGLVATPFLLLALLAISLTLWVSWQLDGGAAAVNEAGRMRMQAYRMSLAQAANDPVSLRAHISEFERSVELLRNGDPERPLFVPWDEQVIERYAAVETAWQAFRPTISTTANPQLGATTASFVQQIDGLVVAIERHMSRWTAMLHLLQLATMALAVLGASALLYTGYLFVLEPVGQLKRATEQIQRGDLGARVSAVGNDEFATLASGFNGMAEHLESMYRNLEGKVAEKTAQLEEKRSRLEALYGVTALVAATTTLEALARGFVEQVAKVVHADGAALRWSDEDNEKYVMLASTGLPEAMSAEEHCLMADQCNCGMPSAPPGARVIPIRADHPTHLPHCEKAGFSTVVCVPVRHHDGAIRALYGEVPREAQNLALWLELGREAALPVAEPGPEVLRRTEQRAVVLQLERLMDYPMVRQRVEAGSLTLHGWHYVIEDGEIHVFDVQQGGFVPASMSEHAGTGPYLTGEPDQMLDASGIPFA